MFTPILAQASTEIPWNGLPEWLTHLFGFLAIVLLVLMVAYYWKKVFGRRPPIDDALKDLVKTLRSEIHREKNSVLKEVRLSLAPIVARMEKAESSIDDIQMDRARKWEKLTNEMHEIATNVAYLRGQENERKNK